MNLGVAKKIKLRSLVPKTSKIREINFDSISRPVARASPGLDRSDVQIRSRPGLGGVGLGDPPRLSTAQLGATL